MSHIYSVTYSCYQAKLRILLNGKQCLSSSSTIMQFMNEPIYKWADKLLELLYQEIEEDYELHFTARKEEALILSLQAKQYPHCIRFTAFQPPINSSLQERILGLSRLIKENRLYDLPRANIKAVFVGRDRILSELREDISRLEIKNQFVSVSFVTLHWEQRAELLEDDLPIYLWDQLPENTNVAEGRAKYAFSCIFSDKTELLGMNNRVCSYSFRREEFFDVIFKCFLLIPLVEVFSSCAKWLSQHISSPLVQKKIQELLAEKPIVNICAEEQIEQGTSTPLHIDIVPSGAKPPELSFQYQPSGIVECSQQWITALKTGSTSVLVFEKGEVDPIATLRLNVIKRNRISRITLSEYSLLLGEGDSYTISKEYEPSDADNIHMIQWYSDNDKVATVDNGHVMAVGTGECTIWCAAEKVSINCRVKCKPYLSDIVLPPDLLQGELTLCLGERIPLKIKCIPEDAIDGIVKVTSNNLLIATIEDNSIIACGLGSCVISIESSRGRIRKSIHLQVVKNKAKEKNSLLSRIFRWR